MISSTLPSLTSGRSGSLRRTGLGLASSSRLEVPLPDQHHGGECLAVADDSGDSHDGEYEDNDYQSGESEEAGPIELDEDDEDDEDITADHGAQRPFGHQFLESQRSTVTVRVTPTQSSDQRTGYPGRKTPGAPRVTHNRHIPGPPAAPPPQSNPPLTPTLSPNHASSATTEHENEDPQVTSSRRNTATGIELIIQKKAREIIWDMTLFTDPFPDPITLNEMIEECWRIARRELEFHSFGDVTPGSIEQVS